MTADNVTPQKLADELVSSTKAVVRQLLAAKMREENLNDHYNEEPFLLLRELCYVVEELDWFDGKPITAVRHLRAQHARRCEGLMHAIEWNYNGVPESTAIEGLRIAMKDIRSDRELEHLVRLLHSEYSIFRTGTLKQWLGTTDGWTPPNQKG